MIDIDKTLEKLRASVEWEETKHGGSVESRIMAEAKKAIEDLQEELELLKTELVKESTFKINMLKHQIRRNCGN